MTPKEKANYATHETRSSDASTFDEICIRCGSTDQVPGGWGGLVRPCTKETEDHKTARLAGELNEKAQ